MARGDVLLISLPATDGREQSGRRPAVAVQTDIAGEPMLMVAPVTSNLKASRFRFTVKIEPSAGNGLSETSVIMVFQMRAIDKARIIKKLGSLSKIHDRKRILVVGFIDPRSAPDDLLELSHRLDALVEHNYFAGLCIHPSGQQLGRRYDYGVLTFRQNEVV